METPIDPETLERGLRLRRMTSEFLRGMTPQERDRVLQTHMAEARGPAGNARVLCAMTDLLIRSRRALRQQETGHGG